MVFRPRRRASISVQVTIGQSAIQQVSSHRHLGVVFNEVLTWSDHVDSVILSASRKLGFLRRIAKRLDTTVLLTLITSSIRPAMEYANLAWAGLSEFDSNRLEKINRRAARTALKYPSSDLPHALVLARAGVQTLKERRKINQARFCARTLARRDSWPPHMAEALSPWLTTPANHSMTLRGNAVRLPRPKTEVMRKSPFYTAFLTWNTLPPNLQDSPNLNSLKLYFSLLS